MFKRIREICKHRYFFIEHIRMRVDSLLVGEKPSLRRGLGVDVEDFREYVFGDDYRNIDWKVSARIPYSDYPRFIVREYREEKALNMFILLDVSASMRYGEKWLTAIGCLISLIEIARRSKDKVGVGTLCVKDPKIIVPISPVGLSEYLFRQICKGEIEPMGSVGIYESVKRLSSYFSRRNFVVLITDAAHEVEEIKDSLKFIREKSMGVGVIMIIDRRELEIPIAGLITLEDYEIPTSLGLEGDDAKMLSAYLKRHLRKIELSIENMGIPYVKITRYAEIPQKIRKLVSLYGKTREVSYV
ncbi:MAG: hypothetical protein DRJ51_04810 [Thermoprotei archaeon]|nr:MAG: hypothetical protein DRJ51_04810 [Thermoprotei archaeon]